jgi:putative SOS response-associated peptidase YedK
MQRRAFRYVNRPNLRPRYNIAPTQEAPVIRPRGRTSDAERELAELRWGLVPFWSKGPGTGPLMINARSETVATMLAFRDAFRSRRCLVPADGFYEWKRPAARTKAPKQAFRIRPRDNGPIAFAGIWESWRMPEGGVLESFAILTMESRGMIRDIHERMPVMLAADDFELWLDVAAPDSASVLERLRLQPVESLVADPVSSYVNTVRHDDPHCFDPPEKVQTSLL